ncbi:MAG: HIRAN domain-containing protein [Rhodocyclaceae bacterium]|nr:HIRAN domain-containing protein [Rhodocyclaceae bacterium]MDP1956618.1 HIRAN domain-containing protein [Rhodocyclaceae bacterium]
MRFLLICLGLAFGFVAQAQTVKLLVQSSPLAGFQYHAGAVLWEQMKEGDALTLVREPDNRHDARAVRVEWQGRQLGYLPRAENEAVAAAMDRGERVEGRIAALVRHKNPWRRLRIDVLVVL